MAYIFSAIVDEHVTKTDLENFRKAYDEQAKRGGYILYIYFSMILYHLFLKIGSFSTERDYRL